MLPPNLRPTDVVALLAVKRTGSISGAARVQQVTPSQVSKAVARLEQSLSAALLVRAGRGVQLTQAAERLVPHLEQVVERLTLLRSVAADLPSLTVAAPSSLTDVFLPVMAAGLTGVRMRALQMPPALIRQHAPDALFDVVLLDESLPSPWVSTEVGILRKGLFASRQLAKQLGHFPVRQERLTSVPFISPIHNAERQFVPIEDDCPLGASKRTMGHQAQTLGLALELAAVTHQLVFGPVVGARRYVKLGLLVEVPVKGWDVRERFHVSCDATRVRASVQRNLLRAVRAIL